MKLRRLVLRRGSMAVCKGMQSDGMLAYTVRLNILRQPSLTVEHSTPSSNSYSSSVNMSVLQRL